MRSTGLSLHRFYLSLTLVIGLCGAVPGAAAAQTGSSLANFGASSTFNSISVRAVFAGDSNANNSATVKFRPAGSSTWLDAYRPVADRRATISGQANPYVNQFRGSIVGLSAGTTYEVQVTIADPDGVSGTSTLSGSVSTLSESVPLSGTTWYVDDVATNGSGSSTSPFNSIPSALAAASPGDRIVVRPGAYPPFTVSRSGHAGGWIAITGENRDSTIITGGARNNVTIDADYVQVTNLRFKQSQNNSVEIGANHHHVWLGNLYHEDVSAQRSYNDAGVLINGGSHHVYVLDNTILAPGLTAAAAANPRWDSPGAGIHVGGAMSPEGTFVFNGNTIVGGFRDCIGNSGESFGSSTRDNTDISNNVISGCKDDGIQMEGDDINLRIWGNDITANNGYSAIAMASSFVGPVYVYRNLIRITWTGAAGSAFKIAGAIDTFYFHNTILTSGSAHDGFARGGTGQVLKNNIIIAQANPLYCMGSAGGSQYDYNLYFRPNGGNIVSYWNCGATDFATIAAFTGATGNEAHGISADPLLADSAMRLSSSSPAVNRGTILPNFNDAQSAWPFGGTAPDIGAHEIGAPASSAPSSGPPPPPNVRILSSL